MKKIFIFIFPLFFPISLRSQTPCECEAAKKQNTNFRRNFDRVSLDSAYFYTLKIKDGKGDICDAFYYYWNSIISIEKKDYDNARKYLDKEYSILNKINCPERMAKHYSNYSFFYSSINKQDSAVYPLLKALKIVENENLPHEQIRVCELLGELFYSIDKKTARKHMMKGLAIARLSSDFESLTMMLNQISDKYLIEAQTTNNPIYIDSAFKFAYEGLVYAKRIDNVYYLLLSYLNISKVYALKKNPTKSFAYSDSVLLNAPRHNNTFNLLISYTYLDRSETYYILNQYEKSREMADSALQFAQIFNPKEKTLPLEYIYLNSKKLNDYEKALSAYEQMSSIKDSLFTLKNNSIITEMERKYQQEKNERKIETLNQEKKIYILLAIAGLLVAFSIIFFLRQKSLKLKQTNLETEQRLNRSRINPHFYFNAMTSLQFLAAKEADRKKLVTHFSSFSKLMRQTLESSYDEHITIAKEIEFISDYLKLQELTKGTRFSYTITVEPAIDPESIKLPAMIIQPFIENSIEHGFSTIQEGGMIHIYFKLLKHELIVEVEDNGFESKENHKENHISRAIQITKDRLRLLNLKRKSNARFEISKKHPNGTLVKIFLPLIQENESFNS